MRVPDGGVEPPSLLPSLCGIGRGFAVKLIGRMSPAVRSYGLAFLVVIVMFTICRCCLNYFAHTGIPSSPVRRFKDKMFNSNLQLILLCVATSLGLTLLPISVFCNRANS